MWCFTRGTRSKRYGSGANALSRQAREIADRAVRSRTAQIYEAGCYGSSSSTNSLKPLFMRTARRRFRDLDADGSWAEPWKLTLLEAYYLIERGELEVFVAGRSTDPLSAETAWTMFSQTAAAFSSPLRFAQLSAAYNYFKAQGWVVKMGQTYGGNFVLYPSDPDRCHSQYCVLVRDGDNPNIGT